MTFKEITEILINKMHILYITHYTNSTKTMIFAKYIYNSK